MAVPNLPPTSASVAMTTAAPASPSPTPTPTPPAPAPPPKKSSAAPSKQKPPPPVDDALAATILASGGAALQSVLAAPEKYRFQALYSVVREGTKKTVERHGFRTDAEYFFPASSMKMPIALATYEYFADLRKRGKSAFTRDAALRLQPNTAGDDSLVTTLAQETWRALIVSDNFSANRLLGIVGHREAHETLWSLGLASVRIRTGFATGEDIGPAETSPRVDAMNGSKVVDELAPRQSNLGLPPNDATKLDVGTSRIEAGVRKEGPLSFADKNAIALRDLQDTLLRIMRPELLPAGSKADLASADDIAYLRKTLGTLPSVSGLAGYERNVVADYQLIPFLRGLERVRPRGRFEIYSKVGQAYGFLIANAYVVDKDTGRAFFLTACIYANPDETMNDDVYAYDTIAFPALADVGEAFFRHAIAN